MEVKIMSFGIGRYHVVIIVQTERKYRKRKMFIVASDKMVKTKLLQELFYV